MDRNDLNKVSFSSLSVKKIYYNCSECTSEFEIISLDKENIGFKCNINHNMSMKIKNLFI